MTVSPAPEADAPATDEREPHPRAAAVVAIATMLHPNHGYPITSGDVAALRRMRADTMPPPAFWRLVAMVLEPRGLVDTPEATRRWANIVGLMAEAAGLHAKGVRLGRALSEAKVAETRVLRVLNAQGEALVDALRYAIRPLVVSGTRFDQLTVADLILSDGNPEAADRSRHAIAKAFYGAEFKKSQPETP